VKVRIRFDYLIIQLKRGILSTRKSNFGFHEIREFLVACDVLAVVTMKSFVFWDVTACSHVEVRRRFG
jgi:hypothetical protein